MSLRGEAEVTCNSKSSEQSEGPRCKIYEIPRFSRGDAKHRIATHLLGARNDG